MPFEEIKEGETRKRETGLTAVPEPSFKLTGLDQVTGKFLNFICSPTPTSRDHPRVKSWLDRDQKTGEPIRKSIAVLDQFHPTDARTILAFFTLYWQKQPNPDGTRDFTRHEIADLLHTSWRGANKKKKGDKSTGLALKQSAFRLRLGGLVLRNLYRDPTNGDLVRDSDVITILDTLRVIERIPTDPETGEARKELAQLKSQFRFNSHIEYLLTAGALKPFFVERLLDIDPRAEAALLAAVFLDTIMADKTIWRRNATDFLREDLGLSGHYPKPSDRKKVLERIKEHLEGFTVSTGILHVTIERMVDQSDWKIIITKTAFASRQLAHRPRSPRRDAHKAPRNDERPTVQAEIATPTLPLSPAVAASPHAHLLAVSPLYFDLVKAVGDDNNLKALRAIAEWATRTGREHNLVRPALQTAVARIHQGGIRSTGALFMKILQEMAADQAIILPVSNPLFSAAQKTEQNKDGEQKDPTPGASGGDQSP